MMMYFTYSLLFSIRNKKAALLSGFFINTNKLFLLLF
ncbi:hypothetical protein BN1044_03129 [Hafnia alvei]|uniref:Uncharacterized protein n=1 Tax=Hafnia alvei TaxID=569 RepID=A0A1C6Z3N0_HAFAL|nr:hypothetical protein BN1044_03129 [Hafnia alvei]